jgi:hypothetical protein
MAAVFVGAVWAWYTLPWKGERDPKKVLSLLRSGLAEAS